MRDLRHCFLDKLGWVKMASRILSLVIWIAVGCPGFLSQSMADQEHLDKQFVQDVLPFLKTYCVACHAGPSPESKLDLTVYKKASDVAVAFGLWEHVLSRLKAGEMPPADANPQPPAETRKLVIDWISSYRRQESLRHAGDPGIVLVRRLNSAEYDFSIRDLTGVEINPTKEFPVDPANEAGFDNSGESLAMSPALLKKYLEAARMVSEYMVLKPDGLAFASHPVVTETDRDKYCVNRIVQFYVRQPTDLADYFFAAWRLHHQRITDGSETTHRNSALQALAVELHISPKYLSKICTLLMEEKQSSGPLGKLQEMWSNLPKDASQIPQAREGCQAMKDFVMTVRRKLEPTIDNLELKGIHKGSQPFVLWKNDQYAKNRRLFSLGALQIETTQNKKAENVTIDPLDSILTVPAEQPIKDRYEDALARFCDIFPDAFYVSERGRDYVGKPKEQQEKGRLLSAGFHSMMGYYRDDGPLCDLILSESEKQELDALWRELDFVTGAPLRQYTGFVWFERTDSPYMRDPQFDFARAEDKSVTDEKMIQKLAGVYIAKAKLQMSEGIPIQAIEAYFHNINKQIRWVEQARKAAEPSHLSALKAFAALAWRRELASEDHTQIDDYYATLRDADSLNHEDAMRESLIAILMSPNFCYRVDYATKDSQRRLLTATELATRLSFFLWSSIPDQRLLQRATSGELLRREVLVAEVLRMLRDHRSRSLATEFVANWLDFRRFQEHNSVDRSRFPAFTDELRNAMFEEPVQFCLDVVQNDRSVMSFLDARHTFVNAELASHYGMPAVIETNNEDWVRVEDARPYGRGGLLPMSVFLTKNSPGLRTSPVKRGYWVVRRLLGETIPPPPPNVPELPADESQLGERSLREMLAAHREQSACAGCHNRFDAIGLVFEGYGPIGQRRDRDLGGRAIDDQATFPNGNSGAGIEGLRRYILDARRQDFVDNLCRKLLCFALGRSLILSDEPLVEQMRIRAADNDYRFSVLVESIVTSSQFMEKRGHTNVPITE